MQNGLRAAGGCQMSAEKPKLTADYLLRAIHASDPKWGSQSLAGTTTKTGPKDFPSSSEVHSTAWTVHQGDSRLLMGLTSKKLMVSPTRGTAGKSATKREGKRPVWPKSLMAILRREFMVEVADKFNRGVWNQYPESFKRLKDGEAFARRLHAIAPRWHRIRIWSTKAQRYTLVELKGSQ